ncbi:MULTISPECIES: hypothetical protein [Hydrogenophaga]|uniref:DUF4148 domain-containing protein n=2 Tax=Hydrogenophaga TaxID=47420 RepID=A0ABW2QF46_9BURK
MNMTSKITSAIVLSFAALGAGHAMAVEGGDRGVGLAQHFAATSNQTRDAVRAEYLRAAAAGEVVASGDRASRLAAPVVAQTNTTREQVRAEYFRAVRSGDIVQSGDAGVKLNELYPSQYPQAERASRVAGTATATQL